MRWDLEKIASMYKEREMKFNKEINMIVRFCFCFVFSPQEHAPHEAECSPSCFWYVSYSISNIELTREHSPRPKVDL